MDTQSIRDKFTEFFVAREHTALQSSPLVPAGDNTLLFTNAGMVQFKDVFLGAEKRPYTRATTIQRCVRAGGKHNDLENVGYTARHHTFFEMMGNFSFGDYFKKEAIEFAWTFLTDVMGLPAEKLWVTVFEEDDEAADIWLKDIGVDASQFSRIGEKDNFWSMGDVGPCGPCTEIFYDHGADIAGGPPGTPEEDGDRYIEIWNLVFMQYNRSADGTLTPLPKPSVDTGMGLERLAAIKQGVHDNYDTDTFVHLIKAIAAIAETKDLSHKSLRVIADHIRSTAFMLVDGVTPSNEGRGYVLRRIIRRAVRHGFQLGVKEAFFYHLVEPLCEVMGKAYPELVDAKHRVASALLREEQQFAQTLEQGLKILESDLSKVDDGRIPGETIFKLYDTYGFPTDLTADIARERSMEMDMDGFETAMNAQRDRARAGGQFKSNYDAVAIDCDTTFVGYSQLKEASEVVVLVKDNQQVESLNEGDEGMVVLNQTPFYAESGGQVGDQGVLRFSDGVFEVHDTQKRGDAICHLGRVASGMLKTGAVVEASVDAAKRLSTARNHSATHLLHAMLRETLGEHVMQKGSLVDADKLRFDFSHHQPLTHQEMQKIETKVNRLVMQNHPVETIETTPEKASKMGAMALFGEKYGDVVRVLKMGDASIELCGGTHVSHTGQIGLFKFTTETGVASGIRRVEAVTGDKGYSWAQQADDVIKTIADALKAKREDVMPKFEAFMTKAKQIQRERDKLENQMAAEQGGDLVSQAINVGDVHVLVTEAKGVPVKALRDILDQLKSEFDRAVIVLGVRDTDKANLIVGVTDSLTDTVKAGDVVQAIATHIDGRGGGRADMAQAGGTNPSGLEEALEAATTWLQEKLT